MSEFDQMYREVILDHYKNPRGHGELEQADAHAEGQNPLCGDEVSIFVAFGEDGDTIDEVKFSGRGCAISQAATSMLMEMVKGRSATAVAALPREELLDEIGIPLTPVRLKCALLGLSTLKLALHKAKGTTSSSGVAELDVCPVEELPPCSVKIVYAGEIAVGVYNLNGEYYALEDRCSHDDGPLCEGDFECDDGVAICPRHGANIDIRTGRALTLPAVESVATFPVRVDDGMIKVKLV